MLCPFCGKPALAYICVSCALTTAEERDAALAEVARLTAVVAKARQIADFAIHDDDDRGQECSCPVCEHLRYFLTKTGGPFVEDERGSDAAT